MPRMFGPLLRYELLTSARKVRYYALRCAYVAALGFLLWLAHNVAVTSVGGSLPGAQAIKANAAVAGHFFVGYGYAQLLAAFLLTPALLAPAIAAEKERRTLDYLLTTDLTDRELIFGKLAARLLVGCLPIVAGLGLLGICQMFGGLESSDILALSVLTAGTMASVGALSLLVSVRSARTRDAALAAYFLAGLLFGAPHLLAAVASYWGGWLTRSNLAPTMAVKALESVAAHAEWAEPAFLLFQQNAGRVRWGAREDLQYFVAVHGGIAAVCAILAWRTVRGQRRKELDGSGAARRGRWFRHRFRLKIPLGNLPAMIWKELFASRGSGTWTILLTGLLSFGWLFAAAAQMALGHDVAGAPTLRAAWQLGATALGVWTTLAIAVRAATSVPTEIAQDTWAFLLATRLRPVDLVLGKAAGALRPLLLCGVLMGLGWLAAWIASVDMGWAALRTFGVVAGLGLLFAGWGLLVGLGNQKTGPSLLGTLFGFALVNGLAQLAVALVAVLLALTVQSSEFDFTFGFHAWAISFPGMLLWHTAGSEWYVPAKNESNFATPALVWCIAYPLAGLAFLAAAWRRFPSLTGRNEGTSAA